MKPSGPIVRRSRKTQQSRRLKKLDEDLENNLQKVENRLFVADRTAANVKVHIPKEVRRGTITPDLYDLARKYAPQALEAQQASQRSMQGTAGKPEARIPTKRIGFLRLVTIHKFIRYMSKRTNKSQK